MGGSPHWAFDHALSEQIRRVDRFSKPMLFRFANWHPVVPQVKEVNKAHSNFSLSVWEWLGYHFQFSAVVF